MDFKAFVKKWEVFEIRATVCLSEIDLPQKPCRQRLYPELRIIFSMIDCVG